MENPENEGLVKDLSRALDLTPWIFGFKKVCNLYSIQHYVIKFVSDVQQVGFFPQVLRFPSPMKLTAWI
jgi:hypothetical protein